MGGLTFAGVGVALLSRPPGQVLEELRTALAVDPRCVVLAVTLRVDLHAVWQLVAAGVGQASVGVPVTHAAAHRPHLPQGVEPAESSARRTRHVSQLGEPHPQSR